MIIIKVVFKRLALKALYKIMKEEGGRGNKNNYKHVSVGLCTIKHQYIDAQSHLLHTHTLSLSPSLSLSSTHTHTHAHAHTHTHTHTYKHTHHHHHRLHTHTLTQSKSGRHELVRFLEVEEIGF